MITCVVEFYGLAGELAGKDRVELRLGDGAGIAEVVSALRREFPAMDGIALEKGQDLLAETQLFNIDGNFYHKGDEVRLKQGDRLKMLTLATGG